MSQIRTRKVIIIIAGCFIIGVLFGATLMYFTLAKFTGLERKIEFGYRIIVPYSVLFQLRQNKSDTVIEILEGELDSALFSLAYGLENNFYQMDPQTQLILDKVREYRKSYPHVYTNEECKQKIEKLLKQ